MPTPSDRFSRAASGSTPSSDLATKLKRATAGEVVVEEKYKHAVRTAEAPSAVKQEDRFAQIKENPFYKIAASKEEGMRLPNQKRDAMTKLLTFDKSRTVEQNEELTKAYLLYVEFMEEHHLENSKQNIAGQNAKVSGEIRSVNEEFSEGIMNFKEEISPFTRRLDSLYRVRGSGNGVGILEEIIQDKRAVEEGKKALEEQSGILKSQEGQLNRLTSDISRLQDDVAELGQEYRFGLEWMGVKSGAKRAIKEKNREREHAAKTSTDLLHEIERTKDKLAEAEALIGRPRETKFGDLAEDKAEIAKMLDISSEEHIAKHEHLKKTTLEFIQTAEKRISAVLANVEEVNANTAKTARQTGKMVITSAIMNEAVKNAIEGNQATLAAYEPPTDPSTEDEISKAEREETRKAVLRHIKSVTRADESTTNLRNSLTRSKDHLEAMLMSNEEQIRGTRQLRTSGISGMAAEMAVTMTALADASNAEARHMAQTMVDEMSRTVIDIRSKEVMRQASEMGIQNQKLAEMIMMTQQADQVARISIDEQRKHLRTLNENLSTMTDVTAGLQKTLDDSEAVYAEAQRDAEADIAAREGRTAPANDDVPVVKRSTGTKGPSPDDIFG